MANQGTERDPMQQHESPWRMAQRLFVKVADQRTGMDCEGSGQATTATATASAGPAAQQQQTTSCSYASGQAPPPASPVASPSACPVSPSAREALNPATYLPKSLSEPSPSSSASLSQQRQASTIPMARVEAPPKHQPGSGQEVWMYPSEQMFFNAMKRKGWDPHQDDMPAVVAIHNSVNERAWREVMVWEALHSSECAAPRLKRFQGKPSEYSPKARLLNTLGYALPFDRHDWIIDRCGREVRYIIDFYSGPSAPGAPVSMYLDARPALDSFEAAWDRLRLQFSWVNSPMYVDESQRFARGASEAEFQRRRNFTERREERFEAKRAEHNYREQQHRHAEERLVDSKEQALQREREAGTGNRRNQSKTAYDVFTLDYKNTPGGQKLRQQDEAIQQQTQERYKVIYEKVNRTTHNIITGEVLQPRAATPPTSASLSGAR